MSISGLGGLSFNLLSHVVAFLEFGVLDNCISHYFSRILLLTEAFWSVRRWACICVKTISFLTSQRFISSGCFSGARDMLLSSLILLSDKILSFGVKNIHVIICFNLSCNDHISSVAFLHSVIWAPLSGEAITLLRKALTYSSRWGEATSCPYCCVSLEAFQWGHPSFSNWFALPWPACNCNSNCFSCRPSTKFHLFSPEFAFLVV